MFRGLSKIIFHIAYVSNKYIYKITYPRSCCKLHLGAALGALAVVGCQTKNNIAIERVWAFGEYKWFIGQSGAGLHRAQRKKSVKEVNKSLKWPEASKRRHASSALISQPACILHATVLAT